MKRKITLPKPMQAKIVCSDRSSWVAGWHYYIDIETKGQTFRGEKPYVHYKRAVTAAKKLGLDVVED